MLHPIKAKSPTTVILEGMLIFSKFSHPMKASEPISLTPSSIITSFKFLKFEKHPSPIFFTFDGMITFVILLFSEKVELSISVTLDEIVAIPLEIVIFELFSAANTFVVFIMLILIAISISFESFLLSLNIINLLVKIYRSIIHPIFSIYNIKRLKFTIKYLI